MTNRDRAKLLVAESAQCSAGSLATLLAPWPEAADGPKYLSGRSLARSSSVGWFIVFGLFVRECFALASRRRSAYSRSRRPMNFAKAIPPKMNMHSATKIPMLFVDVGRFSGTCISTSCVAPLSSPLWSVEEQDACFVGSGKERALADHRSGIGHD